MESWNPSRDDGENNKGTMHLTKYREVDKTTHVPYNSLRAAWPPHRLSFTLEKNARLHRLAQSKPAKKNGDAGVLMGAAPMTAQSKVSVRDQAERYDSVGKKQRRMRRRRAAVASRRRQIQPARLVNSMLLTFAAFLVGCNGRSPRDGSTWLRHLPRSAHQAG
ncbi:hypothetical protein N7532_008105 [Penicillium argentinense]|uniref:Uncharacterized protein n=1 Tax=Penicillium argentinense TaxID=1131581 RepID=A0A9W9EWZ2_9EURO|nr:uncharacterized protein N7532_008105 [Penicillium argentinense]KAJ5089421.1 hypothetical protein N7532_008105 [Penicillium argentinense]